MNNILLTGSSNGFGREIKNIFLKNKYKVYSLTKSKDVNTSNINKNYFPEYVDFSNFINLKKKNR